MAKPKLTEVVKNPNPNLFQLTAEAQSLVLALIQSGGEITPEIEARLAANEAAIARKVDGYVYVEFQMEMQVEVLKRKEEGIRSIRIGIENAQERLRSNIKTAMQVMQKTELAGDEYLYKLMRGGTKLVIDDEKLIPQDFKMVITSTVLDKEKINQALKDGIQIPGVHLEDVQRLGTRENEGKE